jgi:uncharacterized protein (DUF1684 family)
MKIQALAGIVFATAMTVSAQGPSASYEKSVEAWRIQTEQDLLKPKGWLSVSGLFWLKEGKTTAGSSPECGIRLPDTAPPKLWDFDRLGTQVWGADYPEESTTTIIGSRLDPAMNSGTPGAVTELVWKSLTITPIVRGSRVGLRLYDSQSRYLKAFRGLKWFSVDPKFRFSSSYKPYASPVQVPITNVLGDTQMVPSPGYVTFNMDGHVCKLIALSSGDGLFFNFHDLTSGKSTYPAGRFLDAPKPVNGMVDLDFNKATNPPCAFTSFATCPLAPRENYLDVAIIAGEKVHHPDDGRIDRLR